MRALVDTHVFLWWVTDDPALSERARRVIQEPDNDVYFSVASAWEIVIKAALGRLTVAGDLEAFVRGHVSRNAFRILPVHLEHALKVYSLPAHHRDPFDRLLVAQASLEGLPIVTADPWMRRYDVEVIW